MSQYVDLIIENVCFFEALKVSKLSVMAVHEGVIIAKRQAPSADFSKAYHSNQVIDAKGCLLSIGLIDPHTHLIFAGDRADEFEMKLEGVSYEAIAKAGGGIKNTVKATRNASFDELYRLAKKRMCLMIKQGCLGFEIKSGYGLDLETECKMLRVAKKLEKELGVSVSTTYLGAHTLPDEFKDNSTGYVSYICNEVLPKISDESLADSVDVFCESMGFSLKETETIFNKALALGFDIKCHAEQRSLMGASLLAASKGALSCDHLEYLDEESIVVMKKEDTVAVLLPGAFYFLKETQKPPVALLRKHQVPMAIGTDLNPGSSPTNALPLMMNMACLLFGLTVEEAWLGVTTHAAKALGQLLPTLNEGDEATFVLWSFKKPVDLVYSFGLHEAPQVFIKGNKQTF